MLLCTVNTTCNGWAFQKFLSLTKQSATVTVALTGRSYSLDSDSFHRQWHHQSARSRRGNCPGTWRFDPDRLRWIYTGRLLHLYGKSRIANTVRMTIVNVSYLGKLEAGGSSSDWSLAGPGLFMYSLNNSDGNLMIIFSITKLVYIE